MNKQHLRRPRIHRAFVRWLKKNSTRFAVPLRVTKVKGKGMELRFDNYPDCLSVWLSKDVIAVHVVWQGKWWDMIIYRKILPAYKRGGFICECCFVEPGESVVIFPTREALWQDHLFEPFLKWVNEELAPARWLQICCTAERGSRWERLIRDESDLDKPDRALLFLQQMVRVDGTRSFEGGAEDITTWLVPLKPETV